MVPSQWPPFTPLTVETRVGDGLFLCPTFIRDKANFIFPPDLHQCAGFASSYLSLLANELVPATEADV